MTISPLFEPFQGFCSVVQMSETTSEMLQFFIIV